MFLAIVLHTPRKSVFLDIAFNDFSGIYSKFSSGPLMVNDYMKSGWEFNGALNLAIIFFNQTSSSYCLLIEYVKKSPVS